MTAATTATTLRRFTVDEDSAGQPLIPGFDGLIWVENPDATGEVHNNVMGMSRRLRIVGVNANHVEGTYFVGQLVSERECFGKEPEEILTDVMGFIGFRDSRDEHRIQALVA